MSTMKQEPDSKKTYSDLLEYPDGQRWELFDGVPKLQASPGWQHQFTSGQLHFSLMAYLKGKTCQVFAAPFDVMLAKGDESDFALNTVVQPDLVIVCDPSRLRRTGYRGVPRLVVEIISPGSAKQDMLIKYQIYQRAGVSSYWIVQPEERNILQHHLTETGIYELINVATESDVLTEPEFPDLEIPIAGLFPLLPPETD